MALADFDLVGAYNAENFAQFDSQRTVNMYVEIDPQAKKPKGLVPFPGYKLQLTPAEGSVVRRLFVNNNKLYDVSSDKIYKIDTAFNPLHINSGLPLNTSSGYIGIDANSNDQIIFVDGTGGYLYKNLDNTFSAIGDSNFPAGASDVAFFDGFFIANVGGTNEFRLSNPNDGTAWTFEGQPRRAFLQSTADVIVGFQVLHNRLYVFGQYSTELFYNAGAAIVPFRPDKNVLLDYGCAAVGSIASGHQIMFWLSKTKDGLGPIVMTDGSMPIPVSTRPLEAEFQDYSKIDDAIGFVYKIAGHVFYQITFPTVGKTWVFDVTVFQETKMPHWYELEPLGGGRFAANCHAYFAGKHIIGDYQSRQLFELSEDYYDHNGTPFRWKRVTRHLSDPTYRLIRVNRIHLDTVKGLANSGDNRNSDPNANPEVFLGVSRDGGVTWLGLERAVYTKIGRYDSRCIWWAQGITEDWVFSLEGYSGLPFMILGGAIDYEVLRS